MATKIGRVMTYHLPHKVTWPFDHVVLQDHVANEKCLISTATMPETTTLKSVVTKEEELPAIKSHNHLKLVSAIFYQIFIFSPNDGHSKAMKNVFYFI